MSQRNMEFWNDNENIHLLVNHTALIYFILSGVFP